MNQDTQNHIEVLKHDHTAYAANVRRFLKMLALPECERDHEALLHLAILMRVDLSSTANFYFQVITMLTEMQQEGKLHVL